MSWYGTNRRLQALPSPDFSVARSFTTWSLAHGISRRMLRLSARRGDLIARLVVDRDLIENPFPAYETLRTRGNVVQGRLVAATVDHGAANEILRSETFGVASGHGELPLPLRRLHAWVADSHALSPMDPPSMLAVDPPEHTRFRRLVAHSFTARSIAGLEPRISAVAEDLLDRLTAEGASRFDLAEMYASLLPVAVIADMLGVPAEEHAQLLLWGNGAAVTLDPGLSWRDYRTAEHALREMHHWFEGHLVRLRKNPGDDLLSGLATMDGPDSLTDQELRAVGLLLLGAGFETTVNLIGNAVALFDSHPDQLAIVRDNPDRWPTAVEEVLRYDSPVQVTARQAYADTEVAGVAVPEGSTVLVMLGGVNRDPKVFDSPEKFDVTRANASAHLALSAGVHYCLGGGLAKLEGVVALRSLYERFPDLRLDGPPIRRGTRVLRGYEHMPVAVAPVRAGGLAPATA